MCACAHTWSGAWPVEERDLFPSSGPRAGSGPSAFGGGVSCIREGASHHPWFGVGAVLVGRGARGRCVGFSPTLGLNQPGKIVGCGEGTSGENRAKE